jgi:hypothetical protein
MPEAVERARALALRRAEPRETVVFPPVARAEKFCGDRAHLKSASVLRAAELTYAPRVLRLAQNGVARPGAAELADFKRNANVETDGQQREAQIRRILDELGYKRSMMQIKFHNEFINALTPNIYGDEYDQDKDTVLARKNVERIWTDVVIQTGRRMGKSYGTAMIIVALLCVLPKFEVMIFSLSSGNAEKMLDLVRTMLPTSLRQYVDANSRSRMTFNLPGGVSSVTALSSDNPVRARRVPGLGLRNARRTLSFVSARARERQETSRTYRRHLEQQEQRKRGPACPCVHRRHGQRLPRCDPGSAEADAGCRFGRRRRRC